LHNQKLISDSAQDDLTPEQYIGQNKFVQNSCEFRNCISVNNHQITTEANNTDDVITIQKGEQKIFLPYLCNLGRHQTVKGDAHIAHFPLKPLFAIELFKMKKRKRK
jgi:hypothetical protein